jgi:hypothetical protein
VRKRELTSGFLLFDFSHEAWVYGMLRGSREGIGARLLALDEGAVL